MPDIETLQMECSAIDVLHKRSFSLTSLSTFPISTQKSPSHEAPGSEVPDGEWKALIDPEGRRYYFNQSTRKTQWEAPRGFKPTPMVRVGSTERQL